MKNAFIAAEDDRFYEHPGVDYQGLVRAALNLLLTGEKGQGGSTITMQVARNFFLTREKTYLRKVNEILLALKIERELSKGQVLELYLNKIYLGNRAYGVGAASQVYYGVPAEQLTLAQTAMIAGLPKAPSRYNPIANPERALIRRDYVLRRMRDLEMITIENYELAVAEADTASLHSATTEVEADYLAEMVRAQMVEMLGERAYNDGYSVYTTMRSAHQSAATRGLRKALLAYEERHGYRGPIGTLSAAQLEDPEALLAALASYRSYGDLSVAVVIAVDGKGAQLQLSGNDGTRPDSLGWDEMQWARRVDANGRWLDKPEGPADVVAVGDVVYLSRYGDAWRLAQLPAVEGAFVSLSPDNGAVLSMVGGFDFQRSKFNRVVQAERQPGSNFKPFIYSAALNQGNTAATIYNDAPVVFDDPALEGEWRPENYSGKFYGPTRLREALVNSRNLVSIRVLISLGLKPALDYAARFGFDPKKLPRDLSLALGSGAVTPLELVRGYAVFANGGYLVQPWFIERIENAEGEVIYRADPVSVCRDVDCESRLREAAVAREIGMQAQDDAPLSGDEVVAQAVSAPGELPVMLDGVSGEPLPVGDAPSVSLPAERVVDERNVYIMRSIMRDVIRRGTGRRALSLRRGDIAGKTGTTNDQFDTWFSGFNSQVVATAWVGFDQQRTLGRRESGGSTALPAWIDYMHVALDGLPEDELALPPGMTTMRVDAQTGEFATGASRDAVFELFREEYAPKPVLRAGGGASVVPGASADNRGDGAPARGGSATSVPEQLF
jgi:penicillin-binding protein 1A